MHTLHDQDDIDRFSGVGSGDWPPRTAYLAVSALVGDADIIQSIAWQTEPDEGGGETTWTLLALSSERFVQVVASANEDSWMPTPEPDETERRMQATAWRTSALGAVHISRVKIQSRGLSSVRESAWTADFRIELEDGTFIDLPASTQMTNERDRARVEAFAASVRDLIV